MIQDTAPNSVQSGRVIKAVAFDIDGTLYPDIRLYVRMAGYFLKNIRFFIQYNKVRKILHRTAPLGDFYEYQSRLLGEFLHVSPPTARRMIREKVYVGLCPFFEKIRPYAHVYETFSLFKQKGYKLGILSDFPPWQKGSIWGVADFCDVILGSEECGALKPSVYTFGTLAQKLGLPNENILYVGNSIRSDINGGKNVGMLTAYIMPLWRRILKKPLPQADISFSSYRQLQKFVLNYNVDSSDSELN